MEIRAFCFDMDGVLTDTESLGGKMLNRACMRQGFTLTDAQWTSVIGTTLEKTCWYIQSLYPRFDRDRFFLDWSEETLHYVDRNGVPVKQGAKELLKVLYDSGFPLALCTNNVPSVVYHYLNLLGWEPYFKAVLTSADVTNRKPHPETYTHACQLLGVLPEQCVGIEDSPTGVEAVHKAGLFCIHIPDLIPLPAEIKQHVNLNFSSLTQVLPWLNDQMKGSRILCL